MSLLVRKIDRTNWTLSEICSVADIPADAITNCLRTGGNKMSVWEIKDEADIDEAALAIVATRDHLETFDVVVIEPDFIKEKGITLSPTAVSTPVDDLNDTHLDLCELSYSKLGIIACYVADRVTHEKVKRYTVVHLKEILNNAISQGRLKPGGLKESLRTKLH